MQIHVSFKGIVQGVGFRYRTKMMANKLNIKGWIKNNSDGSVEAVFQGSPENIEKIIYFCENEIPDALVSDKKVEYMKEEDFNEFKIIK